MRRNSYSKMWRAGTRQRVLSSISARHSAITLTSNSIRTRTHRILNACKPTIARFAALAHVQLPELLFTEPPPAFRKFHRKKDQDKKDKRDTQRHKRNSEQNTEKQERKASGGGGGDNDDGDTRHQSEETGGGFNVPPWVSWPLLMLIIMMYSFDRENTAPAISSSELYNLIAKNKVQKIEVINKETALIYIKQNTSRATVLDNGSFSKGQISNDEYDFNETRQAPTSMPTMSPRILGHTIGSVDSFEKRVVNAQLDAKISPSNFVPITYVNRMSNLEIAERLAYFTFVIGAGALLYKGVKQIMEMGGGLGGGGRGRGGIGDIFKVGRANYTVADKDKIKINFSDVAGLDEAKVEVMEFVQFLKDPEAFTKLGAKTPKGALLVGPPGTGKTLLAKAVAGEANVPFFSISGSDFIEMFVGVGPSRVRDLFKKARENSPCIIFVDEIDAVGRKRSKESFGGNDERENTLNQLLVEMDGFSSDAQVIVLAGTNRADILDKALLRPGRFDRQILIDKPDIRGRKAIFMVHLKPLKLALPPDDIADRMAALTPGFAGADIANICNEAALIAGRYKKDSIGLKDFEAAVDRVIGGLEKPNKVMRPEEKRRVAYHEAGHAVAGWFLEHANPVLKVTIVPRGEAALGYAQNLPTELALYSGEQLQDLVCVLLAGRCAEEIFFGNISTGAGDDLRKVTNIIYSQISAYGMDPKIGNLSFDTQGENQFVKPYSEDTAMMIDQQAREMASESYARTLDLLREKQEDVRALAERLLETETINHDDIVEVLGDRPHAPPEYREFLLKSKILEKKEEDVLAEAALQTDSAKDITEPDEAANTQDDATTKASDEAADGVDHLKNDVPTEPFFSSENDSPSGENAQNFDGDDKKKTD